MKKLVLNENERALIFHNGKYEKAVGPGKYMLFGGRSAQVVSLQEEIGSSICPLNVLLADKRLAGHICVAQVGDREIVLHFVNGVFSGVLVEPGKHAFWSDTDSHEFETVDISQIEIGQRIPAYIIAQLPKSLYVKIEVAQHQKARLYLDQKFAGILDAGTYYYWKTNVKIEVGFVDTRLTQLNIVGQEIMTQDKVSLRINFVCNYRVVDYVKILTEIDNYVEQIHVAAQLALRDYVSKYKLDDILANKEEMSEYVFRRLQDKSAGLYVEIVDAGIKDIILPGEIRNIMNTVLIAEKKAQANVITRREEVASTRSLLNTAKLMEENQTLFKLKELECVERICENVGNIQLSGNSDILSQLLGMLESKRAN